MASLYRVGDYYWVRFRFQGKEIKRSLKTRSAADADCGKGIIETTLYRLRTGQAAVPTAVDLGDYIVSGGTLQPPPEPQIAQPLIPTFRELVKDYLDHIESQAAPSYFSCQQTHFNHYFRFLKQRADQPITNISDQDIQQFLDRQLKKLNPNTVNKQRITLVQFYKFVVKKRKVLALSPMLNIEKIKFGFDRPPFRTQAEINAIIARGGLSEAEELNLWECLYLTPAEIAELLRLVLERANSDTSLLLHALPAYTGMRRGEVLRLKWVDVNLDSSIIIARSRKQSRARSEVTRSIDIHPEIQPILEDWRKTHPKGQYVLSDERSLEPLSPDQANFRLWFPLKGTSWCLNAKRHWYKIAFHTYRHSFASNLAAADVDQRVIDEFMGHTTEEMRKRYRHLFPSKKRTAIHAISYA